MSTLHDLLQVYRLHRAPQWPALSKRDQAAIAVAEYVLKHSDKIIPLDEYQQLQAIMPYLTPDQAVKVAQDFIEKHKPNDKLAKVEELK